VRRPRVTLARLERARLAFSRTFGLTTYHVFWDFELEPCSEHQDCDIEVATVAHHRGVLHLSFGDAGGER
jgi:hypothetical protein